MVGIEPLNLLSSAPFFFIFMVYLVQTADSEVGTPIPDGMTGRIIKGGIIAKAQIAAENLDEIIDNAYILISDMVQKNGYTLDYEHFYWLEFYTISRYCNAVESGAKQVILDWPMPFKNDVL